jgi:hypothetical protein
MSIVSRACSGRRIVVGEPAMAASTSTRLVNDLEPGTDTSASTGVVTVGAVHVSAWVTVARLVAAARGPLSQPAAPAEDQIQPARHAPHQQERERIAN